MPHHPSNENFQCKENHARCRIARAAEQADWEQVDRLRKEITRVEGEVRRAESKLSNEKFVERAPADVVAAEQEKLGRNAALLETLKTRLDEYL